MFNVAVFASGKGSNFEAIINYFQNKNILKIQCLVCDQQNAKALDIAKNAGIESYLVTCMKYKTKLEDYQEKEIADYLLSKKIDLIVLAGYMRIFKTNLLNSFKNKIINIHPSLLPSFRGLDAVKQALEYGVKITGCTVHYIDEEIDKGHIIAQRHVLVEESDTLESLHQKIHREEHIIYPQVIEKIALKSVC